MEAARIGLIAPILVGPRARIEAVANEHGIDLGEVPIVDAPYSQASAAAAVELVREGKAEALMKGSLHTDELMGAVVKREAGLRTGAPRQPLLRHGRAGARGYADHHRRRRQHRADAGRQGGHHPERDRPRARAAVQGGAGSDPVGDGDGQPEGAVDGRGRRAVQDGRPRPDHRRIWSTARWRSTTRSTSSRAKIKKIDSPVAGRANVLMVPDLEAGNMLAKSLSFLAGADAAGIVLGARVPIILTSRADSVIDAAGVVRGCRAGGQGAPRDREQGR